MSMVPSGSFSPSCACSRSPTQTPPVCRPIIAVAGASRPLSSAASFASSASASGRPLLIEVLLQHELRGLRIERLAARELHRLARAVGLAHAALHLHRAVAFVHQLHRQPEAAGKLAREALGAARHLARGAVFA